MGWDAERTVVAKQHVFIAASVKQNLIPATQCRSACSLRYRSSLAFCFATAIRLSMILGSRRGDWRVEESKSLAVCVVVSSAFLWVEVRMDRGRLTFRLLPPLLLERLRSQAHFVPTWWFDVVARALLLLGKFGWEEGAFYSMLHVHLHLPSLQLPTRDFFPADFEFTAS